MDLDKYQLEKHACIKLNVNSPRISMYYEGNYWTRRQSPTSEDTAPGKYSRSENNSIAGVGGECAHTHTHTKSQKKPH